MPLEHILLFKGKSQYQVLNRYTEIIAAEFERKGFVTHIFDVAKPGAGLLAGFLSDTSVIIRSIGSFPVTVMGNGWEAMKNPPPGLKILPAGFPTGDDVWNATKLTINITPGDREIAPERIFGAMIHASAVITDRNLWTDRHLTDGVTAWIIQRHDVRMDECLDEITRDENKLEAVAEAGRVASSDFDTMATFAQWLINIADAWRARNNLIQPLTP